MYYKAREINGKPFIIFDKVARSKEEFDSLKIKDKKKVLLLANEIPKMKYGVCEKELNSDGLLIDRDVNFIKSFKEEFLSEKLKLKFKKIDLKTSEKLNKGFIFNDRSFSLSKEAQLNWISILNMYNANLYENSFISTLDDNEYYLKKVDVIKFFQSYKNTLDSILSEGRFQKEKIKKSIKKEINIYEEYDI